jgi:hypothetical protein
MKSLLAATAALALTLGIGTAPGKAFGCEYTDLVQSWYHRYLHRDADPCGLTNWVGQLRFGATPEAVQAGILGSEEYFCQHGHSPVGFVAGLYQDVLGRPACAHEVHTWVCRLHRCGCRLKLAREFLCAARPELVQRTLPLGAPVYGPAPTVVPPVIPQEVPGDGNLYRPYAPRPAVPDVVPHAGPELSRLYRPLPPRGGVRVQIGYNPRR